MSEIKAKTTRQVIDEGLRTENWDLKGWYKTDVPAETTDFEKPMWVSLEEAQKTANELEKWQVDWQNLNDEKMRLDSKIVEANKILDAYTPKFNEYGHNYDTYDAKDVDNIIGLIRTALVSSKPTTQEPQP